MLLGNLAKISLGIALLVLRAVNAVFEGDPCEQGDAHRRDCVVCLCSMSNKWSCKRDICNDCNDGDVNQKNSYNYYCENGRWTYLPFLQLPKEQVVLPFGPCREEVFKPDWPCNRCKCTLPENIWVCPLELCREDTMLKTYSPKIKNTRLDKLYEFFKYDGKKESCRNGEVREGDECNKCECKDGLWWCKLRQCPEIIETDSIGADTLPDHLVIELPPGMENIREHEDDEKRRVCDPGKRYKKECNTCSCSSDGTVETCTQYDCRLLTNSEWFLHNNYVYESGNSSADYDADVYEVEHGSTKMYGEVIYEQLYDGYSSGDEYQPGIYSKDGEYGYDASYDDSLIIEAEYGGGIYYDDDDPFNQHKLEAYDQIYQNYDGGTPYDDDLPNAADYGERIYEEKYYEGSTIHGADDYFLYGDNGIDETNIEEEQEEDDLQNEEDYGERIYEEEHFGGSTIRGREQYLLYDNAGVDETNIEEKGEEEEGYFGRKGKIGKLYQDYDEYEYYESINDQPEQRDEYNDDEENVQLREERTFNKGDEENSISVFEDPGDTDWGTSGVDDEFDVAFARKRKRRSLQMYLKNRVEAVGAFEDNNIGQVDRLVEGTMEKKREKRRREFV